MIGSGNSMRQDRPVNVGTFEAAIKEDFFFFPAGDANLVGNGFACGHFSQHMWWSYLKLKLIQWKQSTGEA